MSMLLEQLYYGKIYLEISLLEHQNTRNYNKKSTLKRYT